MERKVCIEDLWFVEWVDHPFTPIVESNFDFSEFDTYETLMAEIHGLHLDNGKGIFKYPHKIMML